MITADAPAAGKQFRQWTVVSGGVLLADETDSTTTFTMPGNAVEVTAVYDNTSNAENPDNNNNPENLDNNSNNVNNITNNNVSADNTGKKDEVPKTGDNTTVVWLLVTMVVSGGGILFTRKKLILS